MEDTIIKLWNEYVISENSDFEKVFLPPPTSP